MSIGEYKRKISYESILLTGLLIADQWDTEGNVTGFALLTDDEEKYVLNVSGCSEDFCMQLRKKITIKGMLDHLKREKVIHVSNLFPM